MNICERCSVEIVNRRSDARFCSDACKTAAHRARQNGVGAPRGMNGAETPDQNGQRAQRPDSRNKAVTPTPRQRRYAVIERPAILYEVTAPSKRAAGRGLAADLVIVPARMLDVGASAAAAHPAASTRSGE